MSKVDELRVSWALLAPLYQSPTRAYHDLRHIHGLLREIEAHRDRKSITDDQARLLEAAAWLHDAFYDPIAPMGENERRSALLVDDESLVQADQSHKDQLREIILATAHHTHDQSDLSETAQWFMDIDLSGLSASRWTFHRASQRVRTEFALADMDPGNIARSQRRWAEAMLSRRQIYYRPEYADREAQARSNLRSLV